MQISGWQKLNLTAFPGHLACSIYLAGCNFRCPACNQVEAVLASQKQSAKFISQEDVFKFLKLARPSLGAVVLTGGEPTLQKDLPKFCWKIKQLGYKIKLETNGSKPLILEDLLSRGLINYCSLDIKGPKEKYPYLTGLKDCRVKWLTEPIEESLTLLRASGLSFEICTTLSPLLNQQDIVDIVRWLGPISRYRLRNFNNNQTLEPNMAILEANSKADLFKIQQAISPFVNDCQVDLAVY